MSGIWNYYAPVIGVTRLWCPRHDILTVFHTLHGEVTCISGLVLMRTYESTNQCLVITPLSLSNHIKPYPNSGTAYLVISLHP